MKKREIGSIVFSLFGLYSHFQTFFIVFLASYILC
uniref:Uncharacterized protein n=1 Tax=Anguilla anguilla TaxID=7936 RepID=A0A0E9TLR3_ANGAN